MPSPLPYERSVALRRNPLARLFDDILRRAVELGEELVDVGAGHRIDLKLELASLFQESRVLQSRVERLAHRLLALLRHAGRRREWASHHLPAGDEPDDLFLAIAGKDYFVIQGIVLMLIFALALSLFVVDLIYPLIDPRIRYHP